MIRYEGVDASILKPENYDHHWVGGPGPSHLCRCAAERGRATSLAGAGRAEVGVRSPI